MTDRPQAPGTQPALPHDGHGLRALVIDDNRETRSWIAETLALALPMAQVDVAATLAEAMALLLDAASRFDFALIDLDLPDGSGLDIIRAILQHGLPTTPIVITIFDDDATLFEALRQVFVTLAHAIVRDGEGATKFVEVRVEQAGSDSDARAIAETVAHSPLVKTALFASDPNWGRILAAVGRAPIAALDVERVNIWLDDVQIVANGAVAADYTEARGAAVMAQQDIRIVIRLAAGEGAATVWTCDFSYDYVKINAEYRT